MGTRKEKKSFILSWTVRITAVILVLLLFRCGGTPGCQLESDDKTDRPRSERASIDAPNLPEAPISPDSGTMSADLEKSSSEVQVSALKPEKLKRLTLSQAPPASDIKSKGSERNQSATGEAEEEAFVEPAASRPLQDKSTPTGGVPEPPPEHWRKREYATQSVTETVKGEPGKTEQAVLSAPELTAPDPAGTEPAENIRPSEGPAESIAKADGEAAPVQSPPSPSGEGSASAQKQTGPATGKEQEEQSETRTEPQEPERSEVVLKNTSRGKDASESFSLRMPSEPQVDITNARFFLMSSGEYEAKMVLRNITNYRVARVHSSQICAQSTMGETVCAQRLRKFKVRERQAVWVMFGETEYPLEHVYIRN